MIPGIIAGQRSRPAPPSGEPLTETTGSAGSETWNINLPVIAQNGALAVGHLVYRDQGQTFTLPSGWTQIATLNQGTNTRSVFFYKFLDGTEGSSASGAFSATRIYACACYYFVPGVANTATPPEAALAQNANTNPDSPNLTPSWGAANNWWLVGYGARSDAEPTASPYGVAFSDQYGSSGGSGTGSTVVGSFVRLNQSSLDPAAFTIGGLRGWVAGTIAVRTL